MLPGEAALRAERAAFLATVESLTDEEFERGTTLCTEWSPRDVLAHLIGGGDGLADLPRARFRLDVANGWFVERLRSWTRDELLARGRALASAPRWGSRVTAVGMLGDNAVHHQDVLRGLGRSRAVPSAAAAAILRTGVLLGGRRLLNHRISPTDGGRPLGRGQPVSGTREALGMWLAGRDSVAAELRFG